MRRTEISTVGACLLALVSASPAAAQQISSPYRFVDATQDLGPYVAYIFTDGGTVNIGPNSGPAVGVRFAIRVSDPIQIGINSAYFFTDREVIDPTGDDAPTVVGTESLNLLLLSGRLQFNVTGARSWHGLIPYFIGGLGVAIDVTGEPDCPFEPSRPQCQVAAFERFDFGTSFMGQVGLGTAVVISERFGARITVEDAIWRLNSPGGFLTTGLEPTPPDTEWTNNFQFSLVLSYWF